MQQQGFRARRKPSRRSGFGLAARAVSGGRIAAAVACIVKTLESRQLLSVSVADPAAGTQAGRNVQLTVLGSGYRRRIRLDLHLVRAVGRDL